MFKMPAVTCQHTFRPFNVQTHPYTISPHPFPAAFPRFPAQKPTIRVDIPHRARETADGARDDTVDNPTVGAHEKPIAQKGYAAFDWTNLGLVIRVDFKFAGKDVPNPPKRPPQKFAVGVQENEIVHISHIFNAEKFGRGVAARGTVIFDGGALLYEPVDTVKVVHSNYLACLISNRHPARDFHTLPPRARHKTPFVGRDAVPPQKLGRRVIT
jgi:hypothetical protein